MGKSKGKLEEIILGSLATALISAFTVIGSYNGKSSEPVILSENNYSNSKSVSYKPNNESTDTRLVYGYHGGFMPMEVKD